MKNYYLIIFLLTGLLNTQAQVTRKYSNEFLNIGVDARAFGMSKAVVANTSDVNSGYWNPAGLLKLKDKQISLMHANYFANIATYNYAGFAMPIDEKSAFAISLIRFGVDDILDTTQLIDSDGNIDYTRISLFSAADYAATFSYAKNLGIENLRFGANAKIIRRVIGDFANSWGFGFDAGIQYDYKKFTFGVMARDITTTFNTWSIDEDKFEDIKNAIPGENQELPEDTELTLPKLQIGVARTFTFKHDLTLLAEVDLDVRFAETNDVISSSFASMTPAAGFEFDYKKIVFLRGGIGNFQNVSQLDGGDKLGVEPNIGLGFHYKGISIDYSLTNLGETDEALYSNIFSLKLDWSVFGKNN
ncbi:putative type IX sorting system protein PorV2 [Pseudofulvibacter geojedonensis]|uniref:PorV/PorQ family protein n=1 Tax=Pseudofulvibacter geojedonensis TaxID=1123758 RepID=A0ABW3HYJ5_9FLAO